MSLTDLNSEQKRAVEATAGPLLIIAGAGAGKTKTLTHRIAHLVAQGVPPHEILAITFTNKAAGEMRDRALKLLAEQSGHTLRYAERPFISTFHALGVHILREQHERLGLPKAFTIFDKDESLSTLKRAIRAVGFDPKEHEPNKLQGAISRNKGNLVSAADFVAKNERGDTVALLALVWPKYEAYLAEQKAVDFDDLLVKTASLLKYHADIREQYQERWKYIHIDEYQDTNTAQYEISRLLASKYRNICVVGDTDQTIYSWRGANFRNILNFEKDYPEATIVTLEENYRSTKTILHAANTIIKKNKLRHEKNLFTQKADGAPIELIAAFSETDEAQTIAMRIVELMDKGVSPRDMAILYRANFQSRALEEALLKHSIAYQLLGTRFYDRKEVRDTLAFLRLALNKSDSESMKRVINVPPRGIGATSLAKILDGHEATLPAKTREKISDFWRMVASVEAEVGKKSVPELIQFIVEKTGLAQAFDEDELQDRLENLRELMAIAAKYRELPPRDQVEQFLIDSALMSEADSMKEEKDAVRMMTVHASKGLEFKHVFVTGLEQDLFPHKRFDESGIGEERAEEERRLFYVAITRAEEELHLSYAQSRMVYGSRGINMPSEFLNDIPPHLLKQGDTMFYDPEPEETIEWDLFSKFKKKK